MTGANGGGELALEMCAVSASYGSVEAVTDVSIQVAPGECVALLGRNGAGKTTVCVAAVGVIVRTTGVIRTFGEEISGLAPHRRAAAGIAWIPDNRRVFKNMTVRENIISSRLCKKSREAVDKAVDLMPPLAAIMNKSAGGLSGGQEQMVAIARALAGEPRVLIADEPMEGVAPIVVRAIEQAFHQIKKAGYSIVLAEQNLSVIHGLSDRLYVMERGRTVWNGTPELLASRPDVQQQFLALGEEEMNQPTGQYVPVAPIGGER